MENLRNSIYRALRRSESFFKTDMVYLAKGSFWLTTGQGVTAIASFVLSVAFAQLFTKEAFGNYRYLIALAGVIGTISLTGLGTAVAQSAARGFDGSLKEGFKTNLKWSGGIIAVSVALALYYLYQGNNLLGYSLLIAGIFTPLINSSSLFSSFLNGKKDFRLLAWLTGIRNILPVIILISVLLIYPSPIVVVTAYFLANAVAGIFSYILTLKKYGDETRDSSMFQYAKHLSLVGILNTLAEQADKIIIFQFIGATPLAGYVFATAIPTQLKGVLRNVYYLALPKFASRPLEETKKDIFKKTLRFFWLTVPVVGAYILAAPYIYKIFFPQYVDAVLMSQIFSLSLLGLASVIPNTLLQARKVVGSLYAINLTMALTKLCFLALGLALWGVWGIIFARVAYEYAGLLIVWILTKRATE